MDNKIERALISAVDTYVSMYFLSRFTSITQNAASDAYYESVVEKILSILGSTSSLIVKKIQEEHITENEAISYGFVPRSKDNEVVDNVEGKWYFIPRYIIVSFSLDHFPLVYRSFGEKNLKVFDISKPIAVPTNEDFGKPLLVQFDEKGYLMKTKEDYDAFEKRKRLRGEEKINLTLKFAQDNNYPALTLNEEIFYSPTGIGYVLPDDVVEQLRYDDTIYGHDLTLPIDVIRPIRKAEYKDDQYRFVVEFNPDGSLVSREQYKKYMNSRYGEGRSPVKSMVSSSKPKVKPSIRKKD